jgi:hypothetical protein
VIGVFQGIDVRVLDALLDDSSTMLCLDNKVASSSMQAAARGIMTGRRRLAPHPRNADHSGTTAVPLRCKHTSKTTTPQDNATLFGGVCRHGTGPPTAAVQGQNLSQQRSAQHGRSTGAAQEAPVCVFV